METGNKEILDKIGNGELKKKPKWQFTLQMGFKAIGVLALFGAVLFLISFVYELIVFNRPVPSPGLGGFGFGFYMSKFPWVPLLIGLLFVAALWFLLTQYSFVYHKPLIYLLIGIIFIIIFATFAIHVTSFHNRFSRFSRKYRFPVVPQFYGDFQNPQKFMPR